MLFQNALLFLPDGHYHAGCLRVNGGRIAEIAGATLGDLFDLSKIPERKPRVKSAGKKKKKR